MKNLIIASTSTLHGGRYLEYILPTLKTHFKNCKSILFIPYARPSGISHEDYTAKVRSVFAQLKIEAQALHEFEDSIQALEASQRIITGG